MNSRLYEPERLRKYLTKKLKIVLSGGQMGNYSRFFPEQPGKARGGS
jgi:hypothetical protein